MEKSSKKAKFLHWLRGTALIVALPLWTVGSVFFIGGLFAEAIIFGGMTQLGFEINVTSALFIMVHSLAVYLCGFGILLIEPYAIRALSWRRVADILGVWRLPQRRDVAAALLGWAGYFLVIGAIAAIIALLFPQFNGAQPQNIGFELGGGTIDKVYAFIVIVIAAPLVEELIFRGYLQGNLRTFMPWWLAAMITSAIFGIVHGQWNVGIDVFIMSMVACYLRERTGALWAGVGLHMTKNLIAYSILFLAPPWLLKMLGV